MKTLLAWAMLCGLFRSTGSAALFLPSVDLNWIVRIGWNGHADNLKPFAARANLDIPLGVPSVQDFRDVLVQFVGIHGTSWANRANNRSLEPDPTGNYRSLEPASIRLSLLCERVPTPVEPPAAGFLSCESSGPL